MNNATWGRMKRSNWNKWQELKGKWETERVDREGDRLTICVLVVISWRRGGGEEEKRSKIKSEEARKKEGGEEKEKRIRTKGKMNLRMFQLKKTGPKAIKTVDMVQINNTEKDAIVLSIWMKIQCYKSIWGLGTQNLLIQNCTHKTLSIVNPTSLILH